ncbi:MarR family winged helix-turn-helix transcriptional regulator [Antrihabitans spumae]|uniref:MarR family winged helix-turn-helix transcriptional regulator n=1 Tax=Antrihabitans spumae TaxID=3373370 RepID=A0ABW7K2W8_9NOCA
MSRSLPDRPANTAVLMREAFAVLNNVVLQRLAGQGHEVVRTAHGAVFQFLDDDGTTVSVLAERAGVSKQAMADLVLHLESHGYVTRNPDPTDGRAKLVLLTDLGNEVMKIAGAAVPEIETKLANLVGERRLKQLREDLQVIIDEHWS